MAGLLVVDSSVIAQLAALTDNGRPLYNALVRLYKNEVELSGSVELADFETADYPGYADEGPIEWTEPSGVNGQARVQSMKAVKFKPDDGTYQKIYGWLLLTESGELIGCQEFTPPRTMIADETAITFFVEYTACSVI